MFRLAGFFSRGVDEAEELAERIADLMHPSTALERDRRQARLRCRARRRRRTGRLRRLHPLVMDGAYMPFIGPKPDDV